MFVAFYWDNMDVELLDQLPRGTYRLYDIQLQADRKELPPANGIQFSPDDSMIAVCNRRISLYDWPSLSEKWNVTIEPCHDIHFSDDGRRFAVLNQANDCLFVFDSNSGTELTRIAVTPEHGNGFSFSADGEAIWLPAQDELGGIQEWSIRSGKSSRRIGNATNTWWILFSFLFAGWSFLYSLICDIPQKNQKSLIGAWSLSFSVFAAGVTILIIGVLRCLSCLPLYQNASIRNYILTLSFNTFLLVVACRVLTLGYSYFRATLTRKHK
jgi:WD40 repeat protein